MGIITRGNYYFHDNIRVKVAIIPIHFWFLVLFVALFVYRGGQRRYRRRDHAKLFKIFGFMFFQYTFRVQQEDVTTSMGLSI